MNQQATRPVLRFFAANKWLVVVGLSLVLIGGTMIEEPPGNLTVILLSAGTGLLVAGSMMLRSGWNPASAILVALGAAIPIIVLTAVRFPVTLKNVPSIRATQLIGFIVLVAAVALRGVRERIVAILALFAVLFMTLYCLLFAYHDPIDIDVYLLHEAAAEALLDGQNPYSTGNVAVRETHPFDDRDLIGEYTYPPLALIAYAGSSIVFGDSRVIGALSIAVALGLVLWFCSQRPGDLGMRTGAAVVGMMCVLPMSYLLVYAGWTEALTLPFLVAAAAWWERRWVAAAIMFGLAIATKQYMIVTVPMIVFLPSEDRWKRLAVSVATAFVTLIPFLVLDAEGLLNGVVRHHLTRSPRPDSATLAGLGLHIPTAIGVALAVVAGVLVARRVRSGGQLLLAVSSVLAVFTILAVRGFRNSWWLVAALTAVAIAFPGDREEDLICRPALAANQSRDIGSEAR
ncbi:MAG: glycosyltransferase 87 family protein [Acidimicrobiia bacterium]